MRVAHVALTREEEKNGALRAALAAARPDAACVDLPCVETVAGPDALALAPALRARPWAWVVITSPEAAAVLCEAWRAVGRPVLRIAAVGAATARALRGAGVEVAFVPGTATGRALVSEIPGVGSAGLPPGAAAGLPKDMEVLYPASALASSTVPDGLAAKGYRVTRLNTYSTRPTEWGAREAEAVRLVDVVTFAAPSAVKSWVRNVGVDAQTRVACIGETSAAAAVSAGFSASHVFFPDEPGMRGWVAAVGDAIESTS